MRSCSTQPFNGCFTNRACNRRSVAVTPGSYVELVVSASKSMVEMQRQEIIDLALRELAEFFPLVAQAKLVKAAVVKEVRATYSIRPQLDLLRPTAVSPWPQSVSGRRLGRHRLAGDNGGRCPQRLPGRGSREPRRRKTIPLFATRSASRRPDEAVPVVACGKLCLASA